MGGCKDIPSSRADETVTAKRLVILSMTRMRTSIMSENHRHVSLCRRSEPPGRVDQPYDRSFRLWSRADRSHGIDAKMIRPVDSRS